jgi:hypothetical protein
MESCRRKVRTQRTAARSFVARQASLPGADHFNESSTFLASSAPSNRPRLRAFWRLPRWLCRC